jgi:hypothetical protein
MKTLMAKDMDIFFDTDEFADAIVHTNEADGVSEVINAIFDAKTEVILDKYSEYGESAAVMPSLLLPSVNAENINSRSTFMVGEKNYGVSFIEIESADMKRVYMEMR